MEPEQKSNGALIGSIVIVVILIIGGIYLWTQMDKSAPSTLTEVEEDGTTAELEAELNSMDLEDLDEGI